LNEYESLGIKVILISPENLDKTKEFFADAGFEPGYTTVVDPEREILKKYYTIRKEDGSVVPSTFLIDKEGKLRFKYFAQHNADRPPKDHLMEAIKMIQE